MADLDHEVRRFVAELSVVGDTLSLTNKFGALTGLFGARYFVVSGIPEELERMQELVVIHNLPEDWVSEYIGKGYILNDPIARHCVQAKDPFFWHEAMPADIAGEAREIMQRAESFGLTNGICFPIHNINGFEAGVSVSGFAAPLRRTELRSLYLASIMTFNALRRIRIDHSLGFEDISPREKEVLTWSALGKTAKEIAYILFVSENTINAHVKNAIGKLSASNKTEAVTIAVRLGIINI